MTTEAETWNGENDLQLSMKAGERVAYERVTKMLEERAAELWLRRDESADEVRKLAERSRDFANRASEEQTAMLKRKDPRLVR